jgi:lipoyl(octanoyl) transferase
MRLLPVREAFASFSDPLLRVYLLGRVEFEEALRLQRQLRDQAEDARRAALVLCEHPPLITVGRQGSSAHLSFDPDDLRARRWPVRWVNRGGGCVLHLPGQVTLYAVVPLRPWGLGVQDHLDRLHRVLVAALDDFRVQGEVRPGRAGVRVGGRPVAQVGVAVRDWVTYYGAVLNVEPDLLPFRHVKSGVEGDGPMTSLARERGGPVRMALVRQRLVEHFADAYGCEQPSIFFSHPELAPPEPRPP